MAEPKPIVVVFTANSNTGGAYTRIRQRGCILKWHRLIYKCNVNGLGTAATTHLLKSYGSKIKVRLVVRKKTTLNELKQQLQGQDVEVRRCAPGQQSACWQSKSKDGEE